MEMTQTQELADKLEKINEAQIRYYEAHVTLDPSHRLVASELAKKFGFVWSEIEGDEVMGKGVRGYLTRSSGYKLMLATALLELCRDLALKEVVWQRRKIEAIIFDERT